MNECTEDQFLKDAADHKLTILKDDGIYRHLRFSRIDTGVYRFDIITWPGYLCYTGDMGEYLFSRTNDMFLFFGGMDKSDFNYVKDKKLQINVSYWAEKVKAEGRNKVEEYSPEIFRDNVTTYFNDYFEANDDEESQNQKKDCWTEIEDSVLYHEDTEHEAIPAAMDFEYKGFTFEDFWEYDCKDYTYNYIWCLYAIVWGIKQYNAFKSNKTNIICSTG